MPKDAAQGWERQRRAEREAEQQPSPQPASSHDQGFRTRFSLDEKAQIERGRDEVRTRLFADG